MIAGAGHLSGFDGVYDFETIGGWADGISTNLRHHAQDTNKSTRPYEDKVPHVPMRLFCATFGLLTIPIAYLTIRAAGLSKLAGGMAAVLMCFGMHFFFVIVCHR
jgi:dolichyl-phosphate-mannose--protein O-mannosyl transferase